MPSENSPPPSPGIARRRSSFSPAGFTGFFSRPSNAGQPAPTNAYPGSIATAAANNQQKRMSITTLGLSTSPTQPSSFVRPTNRRGSISSSGSGSPQMEEDAIEEGDASAPQNTPATPFGRRLSFGAQALRDVRVGSTGTAGRRSISSTSTSTSADTTASGVNNPSKPNASNKSSSNSSWSSIGEGLNWGEQLRARARAPSFSSASNNPMVERERALPQIQPVPGVEIKQPRQPSPPRMRMKPDPVGERMLRGDFDMG